MRLVFILLLAAMTFLPKLMFAQQSLPIKDFSVGNVFVYLHNKALVEESVIGDTIIRNIRYGKVQVKVDSVTMAQSYFMRSDDSALYQYQPLLNQETVLHRFGQNCTGPLLPWASILPFCDSTFRLSGDNNIATYIEGAIAINNTPALPFNGDPGYQRRTAIINKPFGLLLDSSTNCQIFGGRIDVPCHTTRPDPGCQPVVIYSNKICTPSVVTALLRGTVRGVQFTIIPPGVYNVTLGASVSTYYPSLFRLQFLCYHSTTNIPIANYGIKAVRCNVPIDTSLVEIVEVKTVNGNRPDSITFANNKAILHCTFSTGNDSNNIIILRPKAFTRDINVRFDVEQPIISSSFPNTASFASVPTIISINRRSIEMSVQGLEPTAITRNDEVKYGNIHSLDFSLYWATIPTRSLLPDSLSFVFALDTTGLENIHFLEANSSRRIREDSVRIRGNIKSFYCTAPTSEPFQNIGKVHFRSISLFATQNTVSILGTKNPPGFVFRTSYNVPNVFRQLGLLRQLPSTISKRLLEGGNVVEGIYPNPARDNLTVRYLIARPTETISVELINTLGVSVLALELPSYYIGRYELPIDVHSVPNGMHFVKIRSNTSVETIPILVAH
ncbi:MAG: T9SS type A sorting domain-containing protein [Candidatus Kapabacteria bacterium]|jgi:hypothetical protein|nr:T9SS type A sorting domain-containing protein [Candidatus Kapabacteria bacterium]